MPISSIQAGPMVFPSIIYALKVPVSKLAERTGALSNKLSATWTTKQMHPCAINIYSGLAI
ncbi:hypothetical protein BpHYR1_033106 [Brachionus plicatilis]|uniref:Uncharacterized protein n=1 Tax=Brachionus plicatilis TaxID=10195 RepID=A0A3M7SZT8_BRAPC|nr:hypothetical protein BpHYR1_033106 [Brachionus plicatilis]